MTVYADKLDRLHETVRLAAAVPAHGLASAMGGDPSATVVAVGSGGSAIVAEYFASCRSALGFGPTVVTTPLTYVLDAVTSQPITVWLFSASGSNPDIVAAYEHASSIGAEVELVTSTVDSELALRVGAAHVHVAPVADSKDGFLATHSLIAAATRILMAADFISSSTRDADRALELVALCDRILSRAAREDLLRRSMTTETGEAVILLFDPHARSAAALVETSLWESGLIPVQSVDFRNFAHGRHVWVSKKQRSSVVAFVTDDTRPIWDDLLRSLPKDVATLAFDLGAPGRSNLFSGLLLAFSYVEVVGIQKGVDPGKPGVSEFGRALFASPSLRARSASTLPVRRKRLAARRDDPGESSTDWHAAFEAVRSSLDEAAIGGLVLDYDGTVVSTDKRLDPPAAEVVTEILRLIGNGVRVAFATGRGGSIGTMLREQFPARVHEQVDIGYYNGGLIEPLSVDIEVAAPAQDPRLRSFFETLMEHPDLFADKPPKLSTLQISVSSGSLRNFAEGYMTIDGLRRAHAPSLRMIRSGHAIDIVPITSSKRAVVHHMRAQLPPSSAILSIGDSGDPQGNDFELFGETLGVSVGRVCHRLTTGWNFAPGKHSGPLELLRILRGMSIVTRGHAHLDVHSLF